MMLSAVLVCCAVLLALAPLAVLMTRSAAATRLIYTACMVTTAISLAAALAHLLTARTAEAAAFPVGVPWLGAHLRLDALSAFFLAVVDLGAMSASLFALGYGEHETAPGRVLPFFPAFAAGAGQRTK
jgi:hydrogenase-4 component B